MDQISFKKNRSIKNKVYFIFIFILIENNYFGKILNFFEKIREPIKTL